MSLSNYRLPIPKVAKVGNINPEQLEYDEVIYDYNSNRYLTLSQMRENEALRKQLELQKVEKRRNLENIIGYYYKRN